MADDNVEREELLSYVRTKVGAEFELSEAQAARLQGMTLSALRTDARKMRAELGMPPSST
jgi:hypothetical protein